ncbi:Cathepsin L [Giardia duodenalis]|uniref:Cathepsin L n=1 Tax=Giardia intestinalis (strain ATCC 50803 / WB clone C6) TaxID=184922 RepID=A8BWI4_GIAIC|nr:Cathepsin L [Giardia intestinalis]KAE8304061.1 Cathepsin L [Giardia intestinalis]|eukprot:XP_001704424.1 Cathepsin L precursor [Giardia lamblia ATCC 50803]
MKTLALLLSAAAWSIPSTPTIYKCKATFRAPYGNNTQHFEVAFDLSQNRERTSFYNKDGTLIDQEIINYDHYYNIRTERNRTACYKSTPPSNMAKPVRTGNPRPLSYLVPTLTNDWVDMGTAIVNGRYVNHYRLNGIDEAQSDLHTYISTRAFQQDFYCYKDESVCIPVRWTMRSISAFGSHFDLYSLDYTACTTEVEDSDFAEPFICKFIEDPDWDNWDNDPDNPVGPTFEALKRIFGGNTLTRLLSAFSRQSSPKELSNDHATALKANVELIAKINSNSSYTFTAAPNHFSHIDIQTALSALTGFRRTKRRIENGRNYIQSSSGEWHDVPLFDADHLKNEDLPQELDWRVRGIMNMAKDQVACGSCWTFGAIGTIEGRINKLRVVEEGLRHEPLKAYSEQSIVDCYWGFGSFGCDGGDTLAALKWLVENNGGRVAFESEYPYLGQNDLCKEALFDHESFYFVTGYSAVKQYSIPSLKAALQDGPVAVSIGITESLLFYSGGVYNDPACPYKYDDLSHAVLAVGYGTDDTYGDYWIVRNSWSPLWGMDGYFYLSMKDNICGILTDASYAVVNKRKS